MVTANMERRPSLERVSYEVWLYGFDVYYDFAQYCFWVNVVLTQHPDWMRCVPHDILARGYPQSKDGEHGHG